MSREIYCGKILPGDLPEHLLIELRVRRSRRRAVTGGSAPSYGVRDYPRREPQGPIVEKRRLRLASCDEALFIITTSPLDSPTASARPLPSSCRAATRGTYRDPGQPAPYLGVVRQGRALLQAVRRHQLKFAPDRKVFSARARGRQRGHEKSNCYSNLTTSGTRESFRTPSQAREPRV
jgi:hypothetical protein